MGATVVQSQPGLGLHLRSTEGGHFPSATFNFPISTTRRLPSVQQCHYEDILSDSSGMFVERLLCSVRTWGSPSYMPVLMPLGVRALP